MAGILCLAAFAHACSLMPAEAEQVRARQMEDAVLPMAETALESGQLETARRLYRRLLDVEPESVPARMGLGNVALREREPEAAARWYRSALTRADVPEERHAALLAHGRAALAAGQLESAKESFSRLTRTEEAASRTSAAWGHNGIGLTLLLEGDLRGATAAMEQAVLVAPEESRFQANLDRALSMSGEVSSRDAMTGASTDDDLSPWVVPDVEQPARPPAAPSETVVAPPDAKGQDRSKGLQPGGAKASTNVEGSDGTDARIDIGQETDADTVAEFVHRSPDDSQQEEGPSSPAQEDPEPGYEAFEVVNAGAMAELESSHDDHANGADHAVNDLEIPVAEPEPLGSTAVPSPGEGPSDAGSLAESHSAAILVTDSDGLFVQFGAFEQPANASELSAWLSGFTRHPASISDTEDESGTVLQRVRIGPIPSEDALLELIVALEAQGIAVANPVWPTTVTHRLPLPSGIALSAMRIYENGELFLQAGAYRERTRAETLAEELRLLTDRPVRISEVPREDAPPLHRLRIGPLESDDLLLGEPLIAE